MKRKKIFWVSAAVLTALLLTLTMPGASAPVEEPPSAAREEEERIAHPAGSAETTRLSAGCQVVQTMRFSRCGHSVTRRISVPPSLAGGDFQAAQQYYDLWQLDTFSPDQVDMSREIDLYCPMHWVLSCSEAGEIVLSRNLYGDGMAIQRVYEGKTLEAFDGETQERLRLGLGFDSQEAAEAFLAAH